MALSRVTEPLESVVALPSQCTTEAFRVLGGVTYWGDNAKTTRELGLDHRPLEEGLRGTLRYEPEQLQN